MALILADRVKESTTTTGTSDFVLSGASTGFQTFAAGVGANNTTYYAVSQGSDWEVGLGTLSSDGLTLARTTVLQSSNSDTKVSFASGAKEVFVTYAADKAVFEDASGNVTLPANLTVTGGSTTDSVQLDLTAGVTPAVGQIAWDANQGTASLGLLGGNVISRMGQSLVAYVTNAESVTITKGQAVYLFSAQGDRATVKLANNTGDATSAKTLGIVAEDITANGTGFVVCQGVIYGLDLSAFTAGDTIYLGATAGALTATKPYAPNHLVYLGVVEKANAGAGQLYVRVQNGYELDELHNVSAQSPANGDTLVYNSTTNLWENSPSSGGASFEVGEVMLATSAPAVGTWLETGKYYSKASYPTLATALGSVADFGTPTSVPSAQLPQPFTTNQNGYSPYITTTNETVTVAVGTGGAIRKTTDGSNWVGVPSTTTSQLNEVRYINSNFVAVGASGVIVTSTDGTTWVQRATASAQAMLSVAFGNTKYVVVGASGVIQYSSDLITWTNASVATANPFNRVIYANSLFVAVGSSGICYTSPDGVNWTSRSAGSSLFYDVIYANGLFVAIGALCYTSPDGITWTFRATTGTLYQVIYANSLFVAIGTSGSISTSTDGTTWTARTSNTSRNFTSITWNSTNYVAVGAIGLYCTSPDGITWTPNFDVSSNTFYSVAVINSKTIAFGLQSSVILAGATRAEVLQNGTWNYQVNAQSTTNPRVIAYNGTDQYVAVGNSGAIMSSADGQTWVGRYSGVNSAFDKVQYLNNNYIVMGNGNIATSSNGTTWTLPTIGSTTYNAAAYGASIYVVVGNGGSVYSSPDLTTWTIQSAGANQFNDVIYANSIFVAVGASGDCYSSPDGITWTSRSAGTSTFNRIIYANGLFVAVGSALYTSADGITWTSRSTGVSAQLNDVVWNGSLFCAVGSTGKITTSPDGATWTGRSPGDSTVTLNSISWNGTRFVVTNTNNGVAWVSTDGITWFRSSTVYLGATLYSCYLGGKFLAVGNNFIQTSTDGLTWTNCDHVQYVPASINKLYKLGNNYYALTSSGLFQSTDGVTFTAVRQSPAGQISFMAYSGSAWVAVSSAVSGQPQAFYKSTDGTTWTKAADFGTLTTTSTVAVAAIDLVYANGNFVSGQAITLAQNIPYTIYTSTDGVTWTGRQTPYLARPVTAMGSDGTNTVFSSTSGTFKSTDGGATWTILTAVANSPVIYSNGAWVFNLANGNSVSPDLSNFYSTGISAAGQVASNIYVSGNNIASIFSQNKLYFNKSASGYVALPPMGNVNISYTNTNKEIPIRGTMALMAVAPVNSTFPNMILETPLYSYDTSTTFWIPPSNAGAGQKAYMYAGA